MNTPVPGPSAPDHPTLTARPEEGADELVPAVTPVQAPPRRMVVRTVVDPLAQEELARANQALAEADEAGQVAQTLIGMPASLFAEAASLPTPVSTAAVSSRAMNDVQTILKRPSVHDGPTDPARPAPDLSKIGTLPPNHGVAPARLPPSIGDATLAPTVRPATPKAPVVLVQPSRGISRRTGILLVLGAALVSALAIGAAFKLRAPVPEQSSIVEVPPRAP